jgi:gliding motility-associated-like protein
MPGSLGGYKIYRSDNGGVPVVVVNIKDTLATSYQDSFNFENGHSYFYLVQAYNADSSLFSSSCEKGSQFTGASIPDSVYITNVSIETDTYVRVSYHISPNNTVKKLILERSDDGVTNFLPIDSLSVATGFVQDDLFIDDKTADVHSQSYYYRLVAIDDCGGKALSFNIPQSIWLQCSASETQNSIGWNSYESWLKGVEGYQIYRTMDEQPVGGEPIGGNTPPSIVSYSEPLAGIDPNKEVCYWIVAKENPGNPYLSSAESVSNSCCILKSAELFMPNAFHPGGAINNRFRPIPSFVDPTSFTMTIFNRWGQQIFETTSIINGWDGYINSHPAPIGLYAYVITCKSLAGQDFIKRGTVHIVK